MIPLRLVFLANLTKTDFRVPKVEVEADPSSSGVRLYPQRTGSAGAIRLAVVSPIPGEWALDKIKGELFPLQARHTRR